MHGRIISGIGYADAETTRLRAELQRLQMQGSGWAKSNAQKDLERELIHRERMGAKRAALRQVSRTPSDALDVLNAQAEAAELAERMKRAGYTRQQIDATTRPMLVNPSETITGRAERRARRAARKEARKERREERKAAGKGIFRKIGKAVKEGAKKVVKGLARLNPVLAGARTAFLSAIKNNAFGLADKLSKVDRAKLRKKYETLGGKWDNLAEALSQGTGQRITGIYDELDELPYPTTPEAVIGAIPLLATAATSLLGGGGAAAGAGAAAAGAKAGGGFLKILELAKPLIEPILKLFGIELKGKEKEEYDAVTETPEAKQIRELADDAMDPNTGGGEGYVGGKSDGSGGLGGNLPLIIGGAALLLIFATKKR